MGWNSSKGFLIGWKVVFGALVLVLGVYLIAPPMLREEQPDLVKGKTPGEVLTGVISRGDELESFRYRSKVKVGTDISLGLTNRLHPGDQEQMVTFSWTTPQGYGEASMYIKGQDTFIYHPLKAKWFTPAEEPALGQPIRMLIGQLALLNPYQSMGRLDLDKVSAKITGTEEVEGTKTTVIEIEPGPSAAQWFKRVLPPQLVGANVADVKQIFWVGNHDLLVHKYLITAQVKILGLQVLDFNARTGVSEFGQTEIKIPDKLKKKMAETDK